MRSLLFFLSLLCFIETAPVEKEKRQVHTGVVPIFDDKSGFVCTNSSNDAMNSRKSSGLPSNSGRSTNEPITFTYTTPPTVAPFKSEYPVKMQKAANPDFPTLRPENTYVSFQPVLNSRSREVVDSSAEASIQQGPFIGAPSAHSGPIYNQAQYFRVLQVSISSSTPPSLEDLIQKAPLNTAGQVPGPLPPVPKRPEIIPVSTGSGSGPAQSSVHGYSAPSIAIQSGPPTVTSVQPGPSTVTVDYTPIWRALLSSWQQVSQSYPAIQQIQQISPFKQSLMDTGAEKDWRNLWGKVSGVFEPFMGQVGEQVGRAMNTFMKHQQYKHKKMMQRIQKEVLAPYADALMAQDEEEDYRSKQ